MEIASIPVKIITNDWNKRRFLDLITPETLAPINAPMAAPMIKKGI